MKRRELPGDPLERKARIGEAFRRAIDLLARRISYRAGGRPERKRGRKRTWATPGAFGAIRDLRSTVRCRCAGCQRAAHRGGMVQS